MKLKHALSGAVYERTDEGLVRVENNNLVGLFHPDGRHHSGELRQADPQMIWWLGMPDLPEGMAGRRHRG